MGALLASLAWVFLVAVIGVQFVFNSVVNSLPGAHLLGYGPAISAFLLPGEIALDLLILLFATLFTYLTLHDGRRASGRQVGR